MSQIQDLCVVCTESSPKLYLSTPHVMKPQRQHYTHLLFSLTAIGSMAIGAFLMSTLTAGSLRASTQLRDDNGFSRASVATGEKRVRIGDFSKVRAGSAVDVIYVQGEATGEAVITAPNAWLDNVTVTSDDNTLTIGCLSGVHDFSGKITVTVVSPELNELSVATAASFTASGPVTFSEGLSIHASSAADVSFGEMTLPSLNISATSAASVYVLSVETEDILVDASTASSVKLKGLTSSYIKASAHSAADIILSGRCNKSELIKRSGGEIKSRGLIRENMPITMQIP